MKKTLTLSGTFVFIFTLMLSFESCKKCINCTYVNKCVVCTAMPGDTVCMQSDSAGYQSVVQLCPLLLGNVIVTSDVNKNEKLCDKDELTRKMQAADLEDEGYKCVDK